MAEQLKLVTQIAELTEKRERDADTIISEYERLILGLPAILEGQQIDIKTLCLGIGIARGTFYNRVKARSFSPAELRKIFAFIRKAQVQ